jgi:hypothetical protein
MSKIKIKCDNCKNGQTKFFHVHDGICFKCNGQGYVYVDENKLKEIEQKENELAEFKKQVAEYEEENKQKQLPQWNYTETMYNFRNKNDSQMSEWEYNFISDLADKQYLKLSDKQKTLLYKVINKFDPSVKDTIEGYFK